MNIDPKNLPDIDIDCNRSTQESILKTLPNIQASIIKDNDISPHIVGRYFQECPIDKISNLCSIDYKEAPKYGLLKIDLLHNTIYDNFTKRTEIKELLKKEPDWNLLKVKEIVEILPHINNHYELLQKWNPTSVEELAMFIAVIRPAKKHLINIFDFNKIKDIIWVKENNEYMFKKSHSIGYALTIKLILVYQTLNLNVF